MKYAIYKKRTGGYSVYTFDKGVRWVGDAFTHRGAKRKAFKDAKRWGYEVTGFVPVPNN